MQTEPATAIRISIADQRLDLLAGDNVMASYPVSTSRFGLGSEPGSFKTPLGRFRIAEKIGEEMPLGTIFRGRIPLGPDDPLPETEDLITSRILWLEGLEEHNSNTRDRFIYIHGTKHEEAIGRPASCGCIRMRNLDIAKLFENVEVGTEVRIET
jgi:lipoprotein-anchoring transpeptidase ErfK/SrfK